MKIIQTTLLICFTGCILVAQNFSDALRYSRTLTSGTARSVAIGNGIGALGGDFSVLSINPAGVATYRKSEFNFSPSLFFGSSDATLNGSSPVAETSTKFFLENAGLVISKKPRSRKWKTRNFAFGINRIADFNETIFFSGSGQGSITERWLENADDLTPDQLDDFESGPAYSAGAIYDFDNDLFYGADIIESDVIDKNQTVERSGGINELAFSYGGNFNNKFSVGFGFGFPVINYEEDKMYQEGDPNSEIPWFDDLRFDESLSVNGAGVNFKLGTILHFIPKLRIGLSYETPTRFVIDESFNTNVRYQFTDVDTNETFADAQSSPDGTFEYSLKTPGNARVDLAFLHRGENISGFLSAGIRSINYSGNSFDFNSNDPGDILFQDLANAEIDNELTRSLSYNLGGELATGKLRLRGGIILEQSPFVVDDGEIRQTYSAGLGYRGDRIFLDFAWRATSSTEGYIPYNVSNPGRLQIVEVDKTNNKLIMTFGVKF